MRLVGARLGGDVGEGSRGEKPGLGSREPVLTATLPGPAMLAAKSDASGFEDTPATPAIDPASLASSKARATSRPGRLRDPEATGRGYDGAAGGDDDRGGGEEGDGEVGAGGLLRGRRHRRGRRGSGGRGGTKDGTAAHSSAPRETRHGR